MAFFGVGAGLGPLPAAGMGLSLVLGLVQITPVAAAPAKHAPPASASKKKSTPVGSVKPRAGGSSATDAPGVKPTRTKLPLAGSAVVASGAAASVGGLPVSVSAAAPAPSGDDALVPGRAPALTAPAPASVRVAVADPSVADAAGVHGVVMSLSRADKAAAARRVHVKVDYSAFADTYGGDYGNRLRLVQMPECVLSTPDAPTCQHETPLESTNAAGAVSVDVPVGGDVSATSLAAQSTVVALDSSASSAGGTYEATSLSQAYGWSAGNQGGSFTYSYPLKAPASLGGPSPQLALTYDSGSVDAKTLSQNGQSSWVGEGLGPKEPVPSSVPTGRAIRTVGPPRICAGSPAPQSPWCSTAPQPLWCTTTPPRCGTRPTMPR